MLILLYHEILFTVFMRCLKFTDDTPKLNIHKYINYNIIKTYIKRLSTTKDFHSDRLLEYDVREVFSF